MEIVSERTEYLKSLMNEYCSRYNIQGWELVIGDLQTNRIKARINNVAKTMFINERTLCKKKLPDNYIRDLFLHEFAHILDITRNGSSLDCKGLHGFKTSFSGHGRPFRKYCRELGMGSLLIPNYKGQYSH